MSFKKLFLLGGFFLFAKMQAQNFELGKVSVAELQEKVHPRDTSAVAAILFEKSKNSFEYSQTEGFVLKTEVKARIKIYKKEGYDWANKSVRYYLENSSREKVIFSNAITYNLVNGKMEKTKLKSDGEFDEVINKYWGRKKITMPNVKEGSIIEFSYTVRSPRIGNPRDWYFQTSIPVNYSEYEMDVPEYFIYNTNIKGFITPKVTVEKTNGSISYSYRQSTKPGEQIATSSSQEKLEYLETRTTYIAENLPAMKEESFVNNIDNYTTSLMQELSMVKYPNEPLKPYSTDWNSVVKTIYNYDDFGPELNKTGYFENDLKTVLAGLTTSEDKIDAILKYVKATVKWNDYYGYSCNDGVKKAYKDKTGNSGEINLMLTAMLRYAGFNANPVLVSTRSNGISFFPNRTAFNYVIAAVENGTNMTLLDATEPFSTPNVMPLRVLNWSGRLIRKDGSSDAVDLMPTKESNDLLSMNYSIDDKGMITGQLRHLKSDYNAMIFRNSVKDVKEDTYLEKLENDNNKIEIQEYIRTNEKDLKLPINEMISFTGGNFSEIIGDKMYVKPLLSFVSSQNPFKQENREYPVDFGFPFLDKYVVNVKIPDGYAVEKIPDALILTMEDGLGDFKFMTSVSGNTIQVMVVNQIKMPIVSAAHYPTLKEYYQKVTDKQNEKIVLKKI